VEYFEKELPTHCQKKIVVFNIPNWLWNVKKKTNALFLHLDYQTHNREKIFSRIFLKNKKIPLNLFFQ